MISTTNNIQYKPKKTTNTKPWVLIQFHEQNQQVDSSLSKNQALIS